MVQPVSAVYPGSFDPVTNGHLDLVARARTLFERVVVAVSVNRDKAPLFTVAERMEMLEAVTTQWDTVEVDSFDGLLVDYVQAKGATAIVRGIRAVTDFDYEFQMALMNRRLRPEVETVFLVPAEAYTYLSSSLAKEVFLLGGNVKGLIPPAVEERLRAKMNSGRRL